MNKKNLIKEISKTLIKSQAEVADVVNTAFDIIMTAVGNGETVNITGFGKFYPQDRAERNGVNPQTGEKIVLKASRVPKFKAGSYFKENVAI